MKRIDGNRGERAFLATEALLAHLHPKEDAAAIVDRLKSHFGSADAMFRAILIPTADLSFLR